MNKKQILMKVIMKKHKRTLKANNVKIMWVLSYFKTSIIALTDLKKLQFGSGLR